MIEVGQILNDQPTGLSLPLLFLRVETTINARCAGALLISHGSMRAKLNC